MLIVVTGVTGMPLHRFIDGEEFQPEHLRAMGRAFDEALEKLNLRDRSDPLVELVARKIIELAQQGERDATRLRDHAVRALTTQSSAA